MSGLHCHPIKSESLGAGPQPTSFDQLPRRFECTAGLENCPSDLGSQRKVPGPAASASTENLLEMQIVSCPQGNQTVKIGPAFCVLTRLSSDYVHTIHTSVHTEV